MQGYTATGIYGKDILGGGQLQITRVAYASAIANGRTPHRRRGSRRSRHRRGGARNGGQVEAYKYASIEIGHTIIFGSGGRTFAFERILPELLGALQVFP